MRRSLIALLMLACAAACAAPPATVTAENQMPKGWMAEGWGSYRFTITNRSSLPLTLTSWSAVWEVKGKATGAPWGGALDVTLEPGKSVVRDELGLLPARVAAAAAPGAAVMAGRFTVRQGSAKHEIPFRIPVPEARLPEPLRLVKGETAGMALMESRYAKFRHMDRTLRWVDQCYSAMIDLTGEKPFGGKLMVFKESPAHPWWAYAGQEMILNTDYVESTLKDFDEGLISFGWIHEVGHNFDVLGEWYHWSGPAAEWQANFKLAYAFETIPDQSFRIKWSFQAPGYPAPDAGMLLRGTELVERFFTLFGDAYLADTKRGWESLTSDEIHTFFQRIQRAYGWDLFRRWYRTYRALADRGLKPPTDPAGKLSLIAAILNRESRVDLTPLFVRWRFPVTPESVKAAAAAYLTRTSEP